MTPAGRRAPRAWLTWIEEQIRRYESARAFAAALGVDTSKLSRWRSPYPLIPQAGDLERLAEVTGTDLAELLMMTWAVEREREALRARPPLGATGSPGAPSVRPAPRPPRSPRRGRRLAGLVLAAATSVLAALTTPGGARAAEPPAVEPSVREIRLIGRRGRPWWPALGPAPA